MNIYENKELASWLNELIRRIEDEEIKSMSVCAVMGDGSTATAFFKCNPADLFMMSGLLTQDAIMKTIEVNGPWLKDIVENPEEWSEDDEV